MKAETPSLDLSASAAAGAPMSAMAEQAIVRLADRYEILTRQPFELSDRPFRDSFRARRIDQPHIELWAVATGVTPLARADIFSRLKASDQASLLGLLDWGVVDWTANE